MRKTRFGLVVGGSLALGCGGTVPPPGAPAGMTISSITVTSRAFGPNGHVSVDETCDGKDVSPQMTWSSPPEGTKSIVLQVDDPDAQPSLFTHWVVFNVPPETSQLPEGADPGSIGARVGINDFQNAHYNGPCPPHGQAHRYRFHVLALDCLLDLPEGANRAALDTAMNGHVLGEGALHAFFSH